MAKDKRYSEIGTEVKYPVQFKGGTYYSYNVHGEIVKNDIDSLWLPDSSIADFNRSKNIIRTKVGSNQGTVKEMFAFGDWEIRITGVLIPLKDKTIQDQKTELMKWENLTDSIEVSGEQFFDNDINHMVIEWIDFKQLRGREGMMPFTISGYSDSPLELEINL